MTPTLIGRWQTRTLLLWTAGLIVTALFALLYGSVTPFVVLFYVWLFGVAWDVLYNFLQKFRWDRDWPSAFVVLNGIMEGVLIYILVATVGLPGIPAGGVTLGGFLAHYTSVWLVVFLLSEGPLRALLPFWRFHGGRAYPLVSSKEHGTR